MMGAIHSATRATPLMPEKMTGAVMRTRTTAVIQRSIPKVPSMTPAIALAWVAS